MKLVGGGENLEFVSRDNPGIEQVGMDKPGLYQAEKWGGLGKWLGEQLM